MLKLILETSKRDEELARLLDRAREYAEVYLLAKKRQKGCDGMGEVATLKDEFKSVLDEMMQYCSKKGYITNNILYDVDDMADGLIKLKEDAIT